MLKNHMHVDKHFPIVAKLDVIYSFNIGKSYNL